MEVTTWNAPRIEGEILTIWIKGYTLKSFKDSEDPEVLEFNRKVRNWEDGAEWCEEIPEFRFPEHARKNRSVGDRVTGYKVKSIIGELGCSGLKRLSKERSERQVLLREEDSHLEWDAQTVESYDWEAELWFQTSFPQVEKQETLESSEFAQDYELGHTRSVFAMMRVWNSNGRLNVGSMVIEPEKQRAVCRYCGAKITYAQCLAHVNNSEWDAKELFTAMTWAHGYTEMSRNPKVTNFAQGEVSIDTKQIWENYRA